MTMTKILLMVFGTAGVLTGIIYDVDRFFITGQIMLMTTIVLNRIDMVFDNED